VSFWSWLTGESPNHEGVTPNDNTDTAPGTVGSTAYNPGDPHGVELQYDPVQARSFGMVSPSPWSGWPAEWSTPAWDWNRRFNALVDIAWACIDQNTAVVSSMEVFRTRSGRVIEPTAWMLNPDPSIYTSWVEFIRQLFRDYLMGEAFVWSILYGSDGYPLRFRVVPPHMMHVEMRDGRRLYRMGGPGGTDVTDDILHIRYDSTTDSPRGKGPLEVAGGRQVTAGLIEKYTRNVVENGGVTFQSLETDQELNEDEAQDLLNQYVASRQQNFGTPPVFDNGVTLKTHSSISPKDMAMIEVAQFTEARICVLLGVPPFMMGIMQGSQSMLYANVSQIYDQHNRLSLRPKIAAVRSALSAWALPSTQRLEFNDDEYSRPDFGGRAEAYAKLIPLGVMSKEEARVAERLTGDTPEPVTDQMLSKPDPEGEVQLRRVL
jgi:HK97 family phage portal protein